jgi:hypothetical protein
MACGRKPPAVFGSGSPPQARKRELPADIYIKDKLRSQPARSPGQTPGPENGQPATARTRRAERTKRRDERNDGTGGPHDAAETPRRTGQRWPRPQPQPPQAGPGRAEAAAAPGWTGEGRTPTGPSPCGAGKPPPEIWTPTRAARGRRRDRRSVSPPRSLVFPDFLFSYSLIHPFQSGVQGWASFSRESLTRFKGEARNSQDRVPWRRRA